MSDYNQSLSVAEARRRSAALDEEGLYWIEEPVRADDYPGHAQVRREAKTAIQTGENWWGTHDMSKGIEAGASDYAMADAVKIGGLRAGYAPPRWRSLRDFRSPATSTRRSARTFWR